MYIRKENEWKIGCLPLPSLYAKCVKPRGEGVAAGRESREGESVVIIIPHSAASTQSRYTWTQTKGEVAPSTSHR